MSREHSSTRLGDEVAGKVVKKLDDGELNPYMSRKFNHEQIAHILEVVLPEAVEAENKEVVVAAEEVLAFYGKSYPNHVSGKWEVADVPRTEAQVREMFAHRLPEFGYRVVRSQEAFPDWLLLDESGNYVYCEVEHRSSRFDDHDHDPALCDLIVCWEHDWKDAPIPVLEMFDGQYYEPRTTVGKKDRSGLFAPRLRNNQVFQLDRNTIATKYQGLVSGGMQPHEAIKDISDSEGVSRLKVRKVLGEAGFLLKQGRPALAKSQQEVYEAVEMRKEAGLKTSRAVEDVADEFGLSPSTVWSYCSRHKASLV